MTRKRLYPVTRIRGEVIPSDELVDVLGHHLKKPVPKKMFTTAQANVERGAFHRGDFDESVKYADAVPRAMAKQAFRLTSPALLDYPDGSGLLYFNANSGGVLQEVSNRLRAIPSLEELDEDEASPPDRLYFELARGSIAGAVEARRSQLHMLNSEVQAVLSLQRAKYKITAGSYKVKGLDTLYPLEARDYLREAE